MRPSTCKLLVVISASISLAAGPASQPASRPNTQPSVPRLRADAPPHVRAYWVEAHRLKALAKEEIERSLVSRRERLAVAKKAGPETVAPPPKFAHLARTKGEQIAALERDLKADEQALAGFADARFLVPPWLGGDRGDDEIKVGSIGRCPTSSKIVDAPDKQTILAEIPSTSGTLLLLTSTDDARSLRSNGSAVFECTAVEERQTPRGIRRVAIMRPFSLAPYVE